MRLVIIFLLVFTLSPVLPLFAADNPAGGLVAQEEETGIPAGENIFSGIDPELSNEALRSAIVKIVSRALKFGMDPKKILAMAKANPLAAEGVETRTMVVTTLATMFASQWLNDDDIYRIAKELMISERWVRQARQQADQGYITPFIGTFPTVPYSHEGRDNIPPPEIPRGFESGDGEGEGEDDGGEPSEAPASPSTF